MKNSIEKSSSLNCSLFPERERERTSAAHQVINGENYKTKYKKKRGAYILDYLL